MESKRSWLGWIAIGLSALALLFVLFGPGFGRQAPAGVNSANGPQGYAQQSQGQTDRRSQAGPVAPGTNAQPGMGQQGRGSQGGQFGPGANAQPRAGRSGNGQQGGQQGGQFGPGMNAQRGPEQHGNGGFGRDGGFGRGGWFHFIPFKLIGGAFQAGLVALLIFAGLWLLRGRNTPSTPGSMQTAPAQAPSQGTVSPTGETYTDDPQNHE